jgi:hypothetical protein
VLAEEAPPSTGKRRRVAAKETPKATAKLHDLSLSDNDDDLYEIEEKKPKGKATPAGKSTSRAKKTPMRQAEADLVETSENNHFGMNSISEISGIEHDKFEKPAGKNYHFLIN